MAEDAPTRRLTVLAVDDELPALSELEFLLQGTPGIESVTAANSSADALQHLRETTFDAIFLDIRMPGLSGLDLAELVQRFRNPPAIIFVTAHESHAATAFDLAAVDYLRKPLRPERLAEAVTRVQARSVDAAEGIKTPVEDADETIAIELGGTTRFVRRSEVIYAETRGDYVRLHTRDGAHLVRLSLGALEQRWADSGFVRVHRRYLVNRAYVEALHSSAGRVSVQLGDGNTVPVSRRHTAVVRDALDLSQRLTRKST